MTEFAVGWLKGTINAPTSVVISKLSAAEMEIIYMMCARNYPSSLIEIRKNMLLTAILNTGLVSPTKWHHSQLTNYAKREYLKRGLIPVGDIRKKVSGIKDFMSPRSYL